ncbi:hypothetical protein QBC39DRAFT_344565 [Podospora conica]|nr:hypothetical protein QBC39DRAFT_344565 [Schizothecium conicum]
MRSAPGMEDVLDGDDLEEALAGCVCFDGRGTFNTEFDDFARTCLPWAQSVAPEDFETISHFATFCAARSTATVAATTTQAPVVPTVAPTAPATATSTGLAVTRAAPGGGLVFAVLGVVMLL